MLAMFMLHLLSCSQNLNSININVSSSLYKEREDQVAIGGAVSWCLLHHHNSL